MAYIRAQRAGTLDATFVESQQRALSDFQVKEKATSKKGKAKERVGERKGARLAPMREREEQEQP